jgi:hypothetical protein
MKTIEDSHRNGGGGGGEIADKIGYSEFFIIFKVGFPVPGRSH